MNDDIAKNLNTQVKILKVSKQLFSIKIFQDDDDKNSIVAI